LAGAAFEKPMGVDLQFRRLACATSIILASLISTAPAATAIPADNLAAQTPQAARMLNAFRAWAKKWDIHNSSVAVMRGRQLLGWWGIGHSAMTAVPIASESKAITAMCIAKLVDAGQLTFNTPLSVPLAGYFAEHPPTAVRAPSITIAQLLTHSSGITYDPSQAKDGARVEKLRLDKTRLEQQAIITFGKKLGTLPGKAYFYNNMNYALLGLVIETVTQTPYETYCFDNVLKPAGVTEATLNPPWRVMSSWGGWKISAVNYARFLEYFLPSLRMVNTTIQQWPKFPMGGGDFYTMGAIMRTDGVRHRFRHAGSWRFGSPRASFGGYFAVFDENVRYMVNYEPTLQTDALHDLSLMMYRAAMGN
jgi:CubicO group peptidase (beta-lactamase class C family)